MRTDCDEERRQEDEGERGEKEQNMDRLATEKREENQIVVGIPLSFYSPSSKREMVRRVWSEHREGETRW